MTFTRSRAYRKNDGCHVEQKNWSVVRQNVGYARFDTVEELEVLNSIHALVRLHTNFFMPSALQAQCPQEPEMERGGEGTRVRVP